MKKMFTLAIMIASFAFANGQTSNPQKLFGLDSIKILPDYTAPWKKLQPLGQLKPQEYKLQTPKNGFQIPDSNFLSLNNLSSLDHMPVAKATSADKMPVLKLGDTETTHFTMLIKPIPGMANKNKAATP